MCSCIQKKAIGFFCSPAFPLILLIGEPANGEEWASHWEERGRKQMILREGERGKKKDGGDEGVTECGERLQESRELCRESKRVRREATRAIQSVYAVSESKSQCNVCSHQNAVLVQF